MESIHFLRPGFLYLLIPAGLLLILLLRKQPQIQLWQNICSKDLIPHILVLKDKRFYWPYVATILGLCLLIIAVAGPAWQLLPQPLIKKQSGMVIVLDLSPGMDAQDIKPSRLQRAIYKISDYLDNYHEGQLALIVFSANPFVVTPLTDDVATIKNLLPALETKIMPSIGHQVNLGISKANDLLRQSGITEGSVLLVTSELADPDLVKSIALAQQEGIKISVLGVGTDATTPIPKEGGGFIKNSEGAMLMATFSQANLTKLAQATHGVFAKITIDDSDLRQLSADYSSEFSKSNHQETELKHNKWHDQGYLLVLLALPFVSLIFRRGCLVLLFFIVPHGLQALSFSDFWQTQDQQAQQLFHQEKYDQANALFQNPEWQAICSYKLGDYERAAELLQNESSAENLYNYGTAKAKAGDLPEALKAYEKVLKIKPEHDDALYNKKIIEEALKQNPQANNPQDKSKSDQQSNRSQSQEENSNKNQDENLEQNQEQDSSNAKNQDQMQGQNEETSRPAKSQNQDQSSEADDENQAAEPNQDGADSKKNLDELSAQHRNNIEKEMQNKRAPPEAQAIQEDARELSQQEDPQRNIDERWLQRVQDDPSALLRRKFLQQYRQQQKAK